MSDLPPSITIENQRRGDEKMRLAWTVNEACQALSISRAHIYALASEGKVHMIKIGGRRLVPDTEMQRLARDGA